ncbi:TNT domain-containing protein [Nakamurella sp. s14-144]
MFRKTKTSSSQFDRLGEDTGRFFYPKGEQLRMRSLPPDAASRPYRTYESTDAPLPEGYSLAQSVIAPWFAQPGGGTQFMVIGPEGYEAQILDLIDAGYLRHV